MRKLLLFPLRLCVGWGLSPRLLGLIGVTMLVMLRVAVGWHFYTEGVDKRATGNWSSAPFFASAKGPFAEEFRGLVWDADGSLRLNQDTMLYQLAYHREIGAAHFGFDRQQQALAKQKYNQAVETYKWIIQSNASDLEEFQLGRQRVANLSRGDDTEKRTRDGVSSLGGQRDTIRAEWIAKAAPAFAQIESLLESFEADINSIATPQQMDASGPCRLVKLRSHPVIDTSRIDQFVPYFDMTIGICLLIGLLTPVAGLAAAGFLLSVFVSQFPPGTGPTSSMYQLVEAMACLVLAATGAGRFAGADYFLHLLCRRVWAKDGISPTHTTFHTTHTQIT